MSNTETSLGEGEAALLLAAEDLLSRDDIPDTNQRLTCFSCETNYVGVYCHNCGQKNDDMRRSLFSLIIEMLGNLTAIDSRIWRTWGKLLTRPGKVAREFADGSRMKWTSPVRAYLAMSILLFGYIALTGTQIISLTMDVEPDVGAPQSLSELKPSDLNAEFALHLFETNRSLERLREDSNSELVGFLLNYSDPVSFDYVNGSMKLVEEGYVRPEAATGTDAMSEEVEDINDIIALADEAMKEAVEDTLDAESPTSSVKPDGSGYVIMNGKRMSPQEASSRGVAVLKLFLARPEVLNRYFSTYLPRVMFFMMPFTMFLGILFIRGRGNALLYDHLVHAAYVHAVFFLLLLVGLILGQHTPIPPGALMGLLTLYMFIYLPMSLGGMFSRGPVKTIWTSYAIGFIYFLTMFFILVTMMVLAIIGVVEQSGINSFSS